MAAQKAAAKMAAKKESKLASLTSALFGAPKKKAAPAAAKAHSKPAAKPPVKQPAKLAKPAPQPAKAAPVKAAKAPQIAQKDAKGGNKADKKSPAPPVAAAKGAANKKGAQSQPAPAAAAKGAAASNAAKSIATPVAGQAKAAPAKAAGKRGGKAAKEAAPRERMAGPSIRTTYDANGEAVCREVACEGLATSAGYCRVHYIKNWKKIKRKEVILKEGKLNQYIEELVAKYPDKYIEAIRQDLANDKDFAKVIYDLDLDESVDDFDVEGESIDAIVGDIKRDFDDEGESGF